MKRLNVYDSVNRNRLLGTHPRWAGPHDHYRFATYDMPRATLKFDPGSVNSISIEYVELQRVVIQSGDGWEAEVCLVTYAPLKDLLRLEAFRLPGEDEYDYEHRAHYRF